MTITLHTERSIFKLIIIIWLWKMERTHDSTENPIERVEDYRIFVVVFMNGLWPPANMYTRFPHRIQIVDLFVFAIISNARKYGEFGEGSKSACCRTFTLCSLSTRCAYLTLQKQNECNRSRSISAPGNHCPNGHWKCMQKWRDKTMICKRRTHHLRTQMISTDFRPVCEQSK